jgi:endonuclease/exonuclease/phosphatase (EEP) superfamily protein YafD
VKATTSKRRRLWFRLLLALLCAGLVFHHVTSCGHTRDPEAPAAGTRQLRVLTYNLYKDSANPETAIDVIVAADPDVVCVQEASSQWIALPPEAVPPAPLSGFQRAGDRV